MKMEFVRNPHAYFSHLLKEWIDISKSNSINSREFRECGFIIDFLTRTKVEKS